MAGCGEAMCKAFDIFLSTGKGLFLGIKELLVVWLWSCEGKGTYSLLFFLLLGLVLAKPEAAWVVFKTALIFWQLQSQGIAWEAQKCLCTFPCLMGQVSLCHTDPACFSKQAHNVLQQAHCCPRRVFPCYLYCPLRLSFSLWYITRCQLVFVTCSIEF